MTTQDPPTQRLEITIPPKKAPQVWRGIDWGIEGVVVLTTPDGSTRLEFRPGHRTWAGIGQQRSYVQGCFRLFTPDRDEYGRELWRGRVNNAARDKIAAECAAAFGMPVYRDNIRTDQTHILKAA